MIKDFYTFQKLTCPLETWIFFFHIIHKQTKQNLFNIHLLKQDEFSNCTISSNALQFDKSAGNLSKIFTSSLSFLFNTIRDIQISFCLGAHCLGLTYSFFPDSWEIH